MIFFVEGDNRTIGLLLVRAKTVSRLNMPCVIFRNHRISDYELGTLYRKDFRGSLPTIEEIEKELASDNQ